MPTTSPTVRSTSYRQAGTRSPASAWRRNRLQLTMCKPGHEDPLFGSSKTHDRADDLCRALGGTMTIGGKAGQDQRPEGGK